MRLGRALAWLALVLAAGIGVGKEAVAPRLPEGVRGYLEVVYRRDGYNTKRLDLYLPTAPASPGGRPAIVAIHGGSWQAGTKNSFGRRVARLAAAGYVVVSVDYTLARPGRPAWPAGYDDVRDSVRWLRRHARDYDVDANRIAALGASAGGHLALLLGTEPASTETDARVSAVVSLYGPTDLADLALRPDAAQVLARFLGATLAEAPELYASSSPIRRVSRQSAPCLLIHGRDDDSVPPSHSIAMADALRSSGVRAELMVIAGVGHSFELDLKDQDLENAVVRFLEGVWSSRRSLASH